MCKWLDEFTGICCNGDSQYVADCPLCECKSKKDCEYYEE